MSAAPKQAYLQVVGVSKSYGPLRALTDVDVSIQQGSVHALVGENGAGKSTLGKIVSGAVSPDHGQLLLAGEAVSFSSPRAALERGVAGVAQELAIVNSLSVEANVFLGFEPKTAGFVNRRELRRRYERLSSTTGFELVPDVLAGKLRTAEKQQLEILRALARDARLIVMDEPTAALSGPEITKLHRMIRSLAAQGTTVLLVSHFLDEVLALADTVTVLRDGAVVRTSPAEQETKDSLIQSMLGRSLGTAYPQKAISTGDVVLSLKNLVAAGVDDVSLEVRAGEIVGLAGLVGSGRTELARAISGAERRKGGSVTLGRELAVPASTVGALKAGVVMISESRKEQGLLLRRSVSENIALASLPALSRKGWIRPHHERSIVADLLDRVGVRATAAALPANSLSGGNQQKILFARALLCKPRVLVADEPTRGVDVGSKRAIYELITNLAAEGAGVLLVSSEIEEVLGLAHRVLVMRAGRVVAELVGDSLTEAAVLSAAFTDKPAQKVDAS